MSTRHHLPLAPAAPCPTAEARVEPLRPAASSRSWVGELTEGDDEGLLQVGDLAKAVGRTVRAIHLYEELGLVKPTVRSKGKYRLFDASALVRVRWIAKLQDLGLTLGEIQGIVREWEQAPSAPGAMRLMRSTYAARLAETRSQIARLTALESELASSLRYLETCDSCDPARLIEACSCCERHDGQHQPPELVEGFRAGNRAGCASVPGRRDGHDDGRSERAPGETD